MLIIDSREVTSVFILKSFFFRPDTGIGRGCRSLAKKDETAVGRATPRAHELSAPTPNRRYVCNGSRTGEGASCVHGFESTCL